jgi:ABC-type oligopeptide transport system ATPase subunit
MSSSRSPTLQEILDQFDNYFASRLKVSTLRLMSYKLKKLQERLNELRSNELEKYVGFVATWRRNLIKLNVSGKKEDFDADHLWDVVRDQYPEYFTDVKNTQDLEALEKQMIEVFGDNPDSILRWADHPDDTPEEIQYWLSDRMARLKKAIADAVESLSSRDELQVVATIIASFSTEWTFATNNFINFIIVGPAGTGKTTLAKHIGRILGYSGLLFRGDMMFERTRSDFIGQFVGQSAPKTKAQLESSREAVLFIDEAYDLAKCNKIKDNLNPEDDFKAERCAEWDAFSSETMTAMVAWLSQNMGQSIVILAGYQKDVMQTVLLINEGVQRRFQPMIKLQPLTVDQMLKVFYSVCREKGIGLKPQTSKASLKDKRNVTRIITNEAHDVLRQAIEEDKPLLKETLQTVPPETIMQRSLFKFEAADMVTMANKVNVYMTASKSKSFNNNDFRIGITELQGCAMREILDDFIYERLRKKIVSQAQRCNSNPIEVNDEPKVAIRSTRASRAI